VLVICPSFVSDCLETIEEIGMRGRETFLEAGGTEPQVDSVFERAPALGGNTRGMVRSFCERDGRDSSRRAAATLREPIIRETPS